MNKLLVGLLAFWLPLGSAVAQDRIDVGGATWMSVDYLTDENGQLSSAIDPPERERLEGYFLLYDHFLAHRLDEINGNWKPCAPVLDVDRWFTESRGHFDVALLFGEVAVAATVAEATPGLYGTNAAVLVSLEDLEPLHGSTLAPEYAILSVPNIPVGERRICGDLAKDANSDYWPAVGDRLLPIGDWDNDAVVPIGSTQSSLAVIVRDDGSLFWQFGSGPSSVDAVMDRIGDVATGNLFTATADLRAMKPGSDERTEFGASWDALTRRRCQLDADPTAERGWQLTSTCEPAEE